MGEQGHFINSPSIGFLTDLFRKNEIRDRDKLAPEIRAAGQKLVRRKLVTATVTPCHQDFSIMRGKGECCPRAEQSLVASAERLPSLGKA
jgi:hypothetical protein